MLYIDPNETERAANLLAALKQGLGESAHLFLTKFDTLLYRSEMSDQGDRVTTVLLKSALNEKDALGPAAYRTSSKTGEPTRPGPACPLLAREGSHRREALASRLAHGLGSSRRCTKKRPRLLPPRRHGAGMVNGDSLGRRFACSDTWARSAAAAVDCSQKLSTCKLSDRLSSRLSISLRSA